MHPANAMLQAQMAVAPGMERAQLEILFDPQTSGGLLIGVAADAADALCSALRAAGYAETAIIGEVTGDRDATETPITIQ
jgi:selenide,water dikinase